MTVQGEGLNNGLVALHALRTNHGLLKGLPGGLRLGRGGIMPHKRKEKAGKEHYKQ